MTRKLSIFVSNLTHMNHSFCLVRFELFRLTLCALFSLTQCAFHFCPQLSLAVFFFQLTTWWLSGVGCFGYYIKGSFNSSWFTINVNTTLWESTTYDAKIKAVKAFVLIGFLCASLGFALGLVVLAKGCSYRSGPSKQLAMMLCMSMIAVMMCFFVSTIIWITFVEKDTVSSSAVEYYATPGERVSECGTYGRLQTLMINVFPLT